MACFHPLTAYRLASGDVSFREIGDVHSTLQLPCGQCIGCRVRRAQDWTIRVMHEASMHERSCVVGLTYGRDRLPPDGSLCHRDFQLFMKRLRFKFGPTRFFMCGEYGPRGGRPHYHAVLFGVDFRSDWVPAGKSSSGFVYYSSQALSDLWGLGRVSVQPLCRETAGYVAQYILKKRLGYDADDYYTTVDPDSGEIRKLKHEYSCMSRRPGIGGTAYARWRSDLFPNDFAVLDGKERPVPRSYSRLAKKDSEVDWDSIEHARQVRGRASWPDSTPERLAVRERVALARANLNVRSLEHD